MSIRFSRMQFIRHRSAISCKSRCNFVHILTSQVALYTDIELTTLWFLLAHLRCHYIHCPRRKLLSRNWKKIGKIRGMEKQIQKSRQKMSTEPKNPLFDYTISRKTFEETIFWQMFAPRAMCVMAPLYSSCHRINLIIYLVWLFALTKTFVGY